MKTRTLLIANTLVALSFGLGSVLAPRIFLSLFGADLEPAGALMMQFGGAWLIGIGLLTWFARNREPQTVREMLAPVFLLMYVVACAVALRGQIAGVLNALGWLPVGINAFLALGFGSILLSGREVGEEIPVAQR